MKLAEAMRKTMRENDAAEAARIADFCRFRLDWNYPKLCAEWSRVAGCEPADVEALMQEADSLES